MTIWKIMQELGKILKQSSEEKRKAVFEGEEVPRGEDVTRTLYSLLAVRMVTKNF